MGELQQQIDEGIRPLVPDEFQQLIDAMVDDLRSQGSWGPAIGDPAPDFALPDHTGRIVSLSELRRAGPVVLVFYRGEWCPICTLTVRALQQSLPELRARGASLVLIGPQSTELTASYAAANELDFPILSDVDQTTIADFGLQFRLSDALKSVYETIPDLDLSVKNADASWNLPIPATIVVAQDGTVLARHVDPDYSYRMEPADILAALL